MTYAPSLTWMHLLPAGARCSAENAPQWFAEKLAPHARGEGPQVRVLWGKKWHELCDLPHHDDLVTINCPGVTTDRTPQQGASATSGLSFTGQRARSKLPF